MRLRWLKAVVLVIAAIMLSIVAGQGQAQETQGEQPEGCPFEKGWKPENLPRILEEYRKWVARLQENQYSEQAWEQWAKNHPEGRANLCNADLTNANLTGAYLKMAHLTEVYLFRANLTEANLVGANLTKAA